MKTHERAANLALAGLSLAPLLVKVNPYLNMMLTACLTVYVGCYCSVNRTPPSGTTSKEHAMRFPLVGSATLLSLFLVFKFLSKDLANAILTAYIFILGIVALFATLLPSVKRFVPKEWNDKEIVWRAPLIDTLSDITMSQLVASIPGGFVCMWYADKKHWLANTVLGICFCIQDGTNNLIGKAWDWKDLYETKLKKFGAPWVLYTAHEDGDSGAGEHDATGSQEEDCDGDHEDGDGGEDNAAAQPEDCNSGQDDGESPSEDGESPSEDSDDLCGQRRVQLLAMCANFPVARIDAYDVNGAQTIYHNTNAEDQVQEGRMVDLVTPLWQPISAYDYFCIDVFPTTTAAGEESSRDCAPITGEWDCFDDELVTHTYTICGGPRRKVELTYLVIPNSIDVKVDVKLQLKDLGLRSRAVYGTIKARARDYGNKGIHLFSCERGSSLSVPSGSSSIFLSEQPYMIALPYRRHLGLHVDVDLTVITISDNHEEDKILKFTDLKFTHEIWNQEREVDNYQIEVDIFCYQDF